MDAGFAHRRAVLATADVAALVADLVALRAAHRLDESAALVAAPPGWAATTAVGAALAPLAADLLGGPVECFAATYVVKPARSDVPTRWHQDAPAWAERLGGRRAATVWVALTDADEANGCLRVVPGSHLGAQLPLVAHDGPPSTFGVASEGIASDADLPAPPVAVPAAVGDVVVVDARLLHAAGPNTTGADRVALALRYAQV